MVDFPGASDTPHNRLGGPAGFFHTIFSCGHGLLHFLGCYSTLTAQLNFGACDAGNGTPPVCSALDAQSARLNCGYASRAFTGKVRGTV